MSVSSMTRMTRPELDLARSQNESVTVAKDLNVAETSARATIVPAPVFAPLPLVATAAAAAPAPPSPVEAKLFVADPVAGATARKESTAAVESAKREIGLEKQSAGQIAGVSGAVRSDAMPLPKVRVQSQASTSATLPSAPATRATAAVPATPRPLANKTTEPPDAWMKRILELKAPGKMREFEGELAKFRKQYPDYLLPEELKGHK